MRSSLLEFTDLDRQTRAPRDPLLAAALFLAVGPAVDSGLKVGLWRMVGDRGSVSDEPYELEVHELFDEGGQGFVVSIRKQAATPPEHVLRQTFALTRAQVRVALLLGRRYSDKEIAAALGIALDTARNHVRAVRLKLNVRSRRDVPKVLAEYERSA